MKKCTKILIGTPPTIILMLFVLWTALHNVACTSDIDPESIVIVYSDVGVSDGFFIEPGVVMSTTHTLKGAQAAPVIIYLNDDGTKGYAVATVLDIDEVGDWVTLAVNVEGVPVDRCEPKMFHKAEAWGWINSIPECRSGRVIRRRGNKYTTSIAIEEGFSGSPIVQDSCVVGMTKSILSSSRSMFIVPTSPDW